MILYAGSIYDEFARFGGGGLCAIYQFGTDPPVGDYDQGGLRAKYDFVFEIQFPPIDRKSDDRDPIRR